MELCELVTITRLSKALFVACLLQCIGEDKLKTKLSCYKDDDDVLGTLLSEVEDSGLPRDFSHESCQISGEVVKDLASICKSTFYMDVLLLSNIRNLGHNLEKKLIFYMMKEVMELSQH